MVNAKEIDVNSIFDEISSDGKITIPSIPVDEMDSLSDFDKQYVRESLIYDAVESKVTIDSSKYRIICTTDSDLNTEIKIVSNGGAYVEYGKRTFNIVWETVNEKAKEETKNLVKNREFVIYDSRYFNALLNYGFSYWDMMRDKNLSGKIASMIPELKEILESNKYYDVKMVMPGAVGDMGFTNFAGYLYIYINKVLYNVIPYNISCYNTIFISDQVSDDVASYKEAAKKRMAEYINDDNISIEIDEGRPKSFYQQGESNWLDTITSDFKLKTNINEVEFTGYTYTLTIDGKSDFENNLYIVKVPDALIKNLEIKSHDHNTGVKIKTNSSNVPLDVSLLVKDIKELLKDEKIYSAFDLDLYSNINDAFYKKFNDYVEVWIPVSNDFDSSKYSLFYIDDKGEKDTKYEITTEVIENQKYAVFKTLHFSKYAIIENEITTDKPIIENEITADKPIIENPNTIDNIYGYYIIGEISLIGLITMLSLKKKYD